MAVASERYVHFLLRPPQRCRVSLSALAALAGICPRTAHPAHSTGLFLKHHGDYRGNRADEVVRAEPTKWVTVAAEDLDLPPESIATSN
jgi:hypothetical protein